MKKLIFASAALCAAATISAQEVVEAQPQAQQASEPVAKNYKSGDERFGAEAGFTFGNGFDLNGGNLNFNYTLTDELTLRLGFGLSVDKVSSSFKGGEGHTTNSKFEINPGITYSFDGTNRLEPYVGAELSFGFDSFTEFSKDKDEDGKTYESETKERASFFGANAVTGFNFYVAEDLYIGAEVKFGFKLYPDYNDNEKADANDDVDTHRTVIGASVNPSVRVGWKF